MSVTFQGSKTLGDLIPGLSSALSSAKDFLTNNPLDKALKQGLLNDLSGQISAFENRIAAAETQLASYQSILDNGLSVATNLENLVASVAGNLATAGIYTFSVAGEDIADLGSALVSSAEANGIGAGSSVSGVVILASDAGAVSAITSIISAV